MSWTPTIYVQFSNEATARAMATALGADFPADGSIPTGNSNYALAAPITEWSTSPVYGVDGNGNQTVVTPGVLRSGYWAMVRFNLGTAGGAAAYAQFQALAASAIQALVNPCSVFLGE